MSISTKLLEDELTEFCESASLSEDGLRAIIERHGCAPKNNDPNINNYEFFHSACRNEQITEGIIRYLLKYFPHAVRAVGEGGRLPIHIVCYNNKNVTRGMVQLLIDAFPDSVRHETNKGSMPLHALCNNDDLGDKEVGLDILKLLIERCPEAIRHANRNRRLPLHFAATRQSPEFCRKLIGAYPGSERIADNDGVLPFHRACVLNTVATAKYLYQLYPESIKVADNNGLHPIHCTIAGLKFRDNTPEPAIEMVQFLLDCNPDVVLQQYRGKFPLYWVCDLATNDNTQQRLDAYLKVLQILYDAYPEAIEDNDVTSNVGEFCTEVQTFINAQLTYARQARDRTLMNTRDENGQLPLHKALCCDNVTLGSIKLLVKGNPSAISCADGKGGIPLHVACQHHETVSVIEYLINLDLTSLHRKDLDDNTALHHACRGANHAMIALLTDKYGAVSVSKRNAHGQLPIDLLFASRKVSDREGVEYTESIFRLLRAYPTTVMNCITNTNAASHNPDANAKMSGKKRKIDNIQRVS